MDTADGEPWAVLDVGCSPSDIAERDGGSSRFGGCGVHRADGDIGGACGDGAFRLFRCVGTESVLKRRWMRKHL